MSERTDENDPTREEIMRAELSKLRARVGEHDDSLDSIVTGIASMAQRVDKLDAPETELTGDGSRIVTGERSHFLLDGKRVYATDGKDGEDGQPSPPWIKALADQMATCIVSGVLQGFANGLLQAAQEIKRNGIKPKTTDGEKEVDHEKLIEFVVRTEPEHAEYVRTVLAAWSDGDKLQVVVKEDTRDE